MTVPTFVTIGSLGSGGSGTTSNAPLPASRVNGNVLVAWVEMNGTKTFALSAAAIANGWNLYPTQVNANASLAMAWRIVDGSETACGFTWTTSHGWQSRCIQYTGNDTTSPIGSGTEWASGNSGAATGGAGVFASSANSGVMAIIALQIVTTTGTPSGWVSRDNDTLSAAGTIASKTFTAGLVNVGDNVNGSFGNSGAAWALAQIEILSPSTATAVTTTIDQTLTKLTQSINIAESIPSTAAQTLLALTQDFEAITAFNATVAQTLPSIAQEIDATVANTVAHAAQTLPGFTQSLNGLMVPNADIAQTFGGFTQLWIGGIPPVATVDQTLEGLTQAMSVKEVFTGTVATALPGFAQEADEVVALNTTINMILGAKNASASAVNVGERTHTGNFIGRPTVTASAFTAGSMVVAVLSSVSTGAGRTVTSIDNVPGQPAWQKRSSFAGSQQSSGVGLEVWWFIATGFISPTSCQVTWSGNLSSWENVCIEYANVDPAIPWDLDPSLPATSSNSSLNFSATPNITGLSTRSDHSMLVGFFGANTGISPTPLTGYTKDVFEAIVGSAHTSSTITEVSKSVDLPQSGISIGLASGGTAWNFIADAIRPQQLTTAITQDLETTISPAGSVDIVLSLLAISQEADVTVDPAAIIDQTFIGFSQEEIDVASIAGVIDQTLPGFSTEADAHETLSGNDVAGQTDQTFEGLTQRIDVVSYAGVIDQTFEGFTQEADVDEELPSDIVEQNLFAIQMEADVVESFPFVIDQTLPGFSQEIDVVESVECTVDQTLAGFGQEIDVSALRIDIDQTLPGFTQELDATEADPPGVIGLHIDQTLPGFQQEIDVSALRIDIAAELLGFTQRAKVVVPTAHRVRENHAAIMPSREMPIHPGELEFFRRKVYARNVDALVPPPVTARYNLTTRQYPTSRIAVDRTPLGKKPS